LQWTRAVCEPGLRPPGLYFTRQIILAHDNAYAAWETPYWQDYFQRSDQIFYKLASGEISVGLANKLAIESNGKFQTDVWRAFPTELQRLVR
jgi:hypothetical protein